MENRQVMRVLSNKILFSVLVTGSSLWSLVIGSSKILGDSVLLTILGDKVLFGVLGDRVLSSGLSSFFRYAAIFIETKCDYFLIKNQYFFYIIFFEKTDSQKLPWLIWQLQFLLEVVLFQKLSANTSNY